MKHKTALLGIVAATLITGCTTIGQQIVNRDGTIQIKQENVDLSAQSGSNPPYTAAPGSTPSVTFMEGDTFVIDERTPGWRTRLNREFETEARTLVVATNIYRPSMPKTNAIVSTNTVSTDSSRLVPGWVSVYAETVNIGN
jgi:hypothetical protein